MVPGKEIRPGGRGHGRKEDDGRLRLSSIHYRFTSGTFRQSPLSTAKNTNNEVASKCTIVLAALASQRRQTETMLLPRLIGYGATQMTSGNGGDLFAFDKSYRSTHDHHFR